MAHFNLENEINEATRADAPLERGPLARWQRKALETGIKSLSLDAGLNLSGISGPRSALLSARTPKTPMNSHLLAEKMLSKTPNSRTPGDRKTPGKNKTPGKSKKGLTNKTPNKNNSNTLPQDRFIPNRSAMDLESGHYMLTHGNENTAPTTTEEGEQPTDEAQYSAQMSRALSEGNLQEPQHKILAFTQKAPKAKEARCVRVLFLDDSPYQGYLNNLEVLYNGSVIRQKGVGTSRHIPQQPDRIMDAPELLDDYYLNLLSWSSSNNLAVALGSQLYIWNAGTGAIAQLPTVENGGEYMASVSWVKDDNYLGVGTSDGSIQLWDVEHQKLLRTMRGHAARVGSLAWNSYILSSGCRSGTIYNHDVRIPEHHVATLQHHTQEVCGLAWSPDGRHLASGGNDNLINIWDSTLSHEMTPLHTFTEHQAAVKALAWCPWQPSLLATGGGTADRHIRFWNVTTGCCLNSIDTNSQVCSILWSKEYKELISGHGFSKNQLAIWKYPSMACVTNLLGHQSRILCLAMSPDNTTVASAAADETIRLWKCFPKDAKTKSGPTKTAAKASSSSVLAMKGLR